MSVETCSSVSSGSPGFSIAASAAISASAYVLPVSSSVAASPSLSSLFEEHNSWSDEALAYVKRLDEKLDIQTREIDGLKKESTSILGCLPYPYGQNQCFKHPARPGTATE